MVRNQQPAWRKSSYSSEGNNCVELATVPPDEALLLRESDEPGTVLRTNPARLRALLGLVRQDNPH
ncbi:DUF397 domain-containing protein [Streptomyces millisiae]|uniref:DUF397 domain-containing protein n=1 Tax=Streptomyces millisiae TaxID=3075542 RepID=A0ABU2LU44_9ACTN|nr:DUF397 domain-containing protein [Streptomyces sp. DSM 44918]MDT0321104.1 DUF397 domain-containing protein [Streptomyces sp. DSM 44918]